MVLSAALHLTGLTSSHLPFLLVAAAQLVIGSMVGARFVGFPPRRVAGVAFHAAITGVFVLALGAYLMFGAFKRLGVEVHST